MGRPRNDYTILYDSLSGTVKWFDDNKGYGFIKTDDPDYPDVFVHINNCEAKPKEKDRVMFSLAQDNRNNKTYAVEVQRLG